MNERQIADMLGRCTQDETEEIFMQALVLLPVESVVRVICNNMDTDDQQELAAALQQEDGEE